MRLGAYGEQGVTCTCGARGPWRCHGYGANGAGWEVEEPFRGFEGSGTCGRAIIQRRQERRSSAPRFGGRTDTRVGGQPRGFPGPVVPHTAMQPEEACRKRARASVSSVILGSSLAQPKSRSACIFLRASDHSGVVRVCL